MAETYYERLGVAEDATTAEIKAAYREKLKETHPDVSDEADAGDRTKRLIEAKEVLVDDKERARYDRLGHEQYVSAAGQDAAGSSSSTASPASQSTSAGSSASGSGSPSDESGTGASGWSDASQEAWGDAADTGFGQQRDTREDQRAPRDSWRDGERKQHTTGDAAGRNTAWRAWDTEGAYSVNGDAGFQGVSIPTGQSLILLCATFMFYPLMLAAALFPPFPLLVNVTLGACVLLVIAYLQSIPTVGILVFGTWSVLVPLIFASMGIGLVTPVGLAALGGTVLPLGLSLLTRAVM